MTFDDILRNNKEANKITKSKENQKLNIKTKVLTEEQKDRQRLLLQSFCANLNK